MHLVNEDKDESLRQDIRQLGSLLGEAIRQQHGDEMFNLVENIRQHSIRFRRDAASPPDCAIAGETRTQFIEPTHFFGL